ncbi:MAG: DesA family fatty acid desaturase [Burkholderiaceae bacterium]|jgi:stearoyl-CoA desaturase (delta-9 desaturase)
MAMMAFEWFRFGVTGWDWLGVALYTLAATHLTIIGVTVYLHRCQAHRALTLHPIVSHPLRFWLWFTTGMVTRQWAAIHRKHHAKCETEEDPHSPQTRGLPEVMWRGAELYRVAAKDVALVDRYGHGCPDDWIERNLYTRHSAWGVSLCLILNVALFGILGLAVWAIQMAWIPFFAAGVINGVGHFWGYRNFKSPDTSRNIVPWGILIGGEELHNNHHANATSPKLSARWYEFDIGWMYIRILSMLGLAQPRPLPLGLRPNPTKIQIDAETVQAVLSSKYELFARLSRVVERAQAARMQEDLSRRAAELRHEFEAIWAERSLSVEQAISALQSWCKQAEASGIQGFEAFARLVRSLTVRPAQAA